jgi:hypothetical protein
MFIVSHEFKHPVLADDWWAAMADAKTDEMIKNQHEDGVFRHLFLPSMNGPILGLWETKCVMTAAEFGQMLDQPDGPLGDWGVHINTVYEVMPGTALPESAWPEPPLPAASSSGSLFWSTHSFDNANVARKFLRDPPRDSPHAGLLHMHCVLPTGHRISDPVFCAWETRWPMEEADFLAFLDGPNSPFPLTAFNNLAHGVLDGGVMPASAFPQRRSFMGLNMMPLMDDAMGPMAGMFKHMAEHAVHSDRRRALEEASSNANNILDGPASLLHEELHGELREDDDREARWLESVQDQLTIEEEVPPAPEDETAKARKKDEVVNALKLEVEKVKAPVTPAGRRGEDDDLEAGFSP